MSAEKYSTPGSPEAPGANDNNTDSNPNDSVTLSITVFKELESKDPGAVKRGTWKQLVDSFRAPKPAPKAKHDLLLWCPAVFDGGRRKAELARQVFLFAIDIDNEIKTAHLKKLKSPPATKLVDKAGKQTCKLNPANTIEQVLAVMPGIECFWHTSFSHVPDWPKYRVAWLLKRPVTPAEYATIWGRLEARFAAAGVFIDPATKNVSRAWFVPAKTDHFDCGRVEGQPLDPDTVLKEENRLNACPMAEGSSAASGADEERKVPSFLQLVLHQYQYVRSPTGRVFASRDGVLLPVDSDAFVSKVAFAFRAVTGGQVVGKDNIDKQMLAIRGGDLPIVDVPIRFAEHGGNIYLDLGDKTGAVVEIASSGCRVLPGGPVAFYRPSSLRPLPSPILPRGYEEALAALEPFRELLAVDKPNWVGCLAFLVQAMRRSRIYSLLICKGPKGIGKTTRARLLRRVIDPRRPEVTGLPKTKDDLCIQAENAHVLVFDNLRFLDHEMSDALCRLATGDGQEKRALYTDRDLVSFETSKPVILTSISDAATEPDILDRALFVNFERPERRRTDDEIDAEFEAMHPRVLGALCFAASLALDMDPQFQVASDIRMQFPCRVACGIEPFFLDEGSVVAAYREANEQALATACDDPFVVGFFRWAKSIKTWEGSAADLGDALTEHAKGGDDRARPPKWMPSTPRGVRAKLDKFRDVFRDHGLKISFGTTGRGDDKRASITIERGAGGVRLENDGSDNAPRKNNGDQAVGVRGVDGVRRSESPSTGDSQPAPDLGTDPFEVELGAVTAKSPKKTRPTAPMHPNSGDPADSSGARCESKPTPPTPEAEEDDDDEAFAARLMSV